MIFNPKEYPLTQLKEWFSKEQEPPFRAVQLFEWLYKHQVMEYAQMTNLPLELREHLEEVAPLFWPAVVRKQVSANDGTHKLLLELIDGNLIETVFIPHDYGNSVCVSSQVGCALGCSFCATGITGFIRNLTVAEMVDQVLAFQTKISSVVLMGMGEPMLNLDRVLTFLEILHDPRGLNIGYRHITISTSGIPRGIRQLAETGLPITLAISLHAPNDDIRSKLMPINHKYPIATVLEAADYYAQLTGRRYTLEYALIGELNDSVYLARDLARLLSGRLCHVNLIPLNPVAENNFKRSAAKKIEDFMIVLESAGIPVTLRREMGSDIDAACGQLRSRAQHSLVTKE